VVSDLVIFPSCDSIKALSLAKEVKKVLGLFADFLRKKRGVMHFKLHSKTF